jgi:MFS family permease
MTSIKNREQRWLKLLLAAAFFMQLGASAGTIGVPILAKTMFDASLWTLAMIGVTGTFVYSVTCFLLGAVATRVSPYRAMLMGVFFFAGAFFFAIFAQNVWQLILVYVISGASSALFWPMLEAALFQGSRGEIKNSRVGAFNVSWSLADALGSAMAGALYLIWPRLPFLLLLVCLTGALVVTLLAQRLSVGLAQSSHKEDDDHKEARKSEAHRQGFANAAWAGNFVAHGITGILRSVFAAPAVDIFKMSPLGIGLAVGTFNAVRTITFACLRRKDTWTYRRDIFFGAHAVLATGMILALFAAGAFLAPWAQELIFVAFILAGAGCGVIYYSSISYSLDLSEHAAAHTRLHEAFLGAGATGMVLGTGGLHALVQLATLQPLFSQLGVNPFVIASMSPFILSVFAVTTSWSLAGAVFLKDIEKR